MGAWPRLAAVFSTPGRQALGWTGLGIIGVLLAGGGLWLALGGNGDDGRTSPSAPDQTPTPLSTRVAPSSTATVSPTPSATPTQFATPTPGTTPRAEPISTGNTNPATPEPSPEPSPEPTPATVVAGGPYCPSVSQTATPTRVLGTVTIGGAAAPAGTVVTLTFDGVAGPSEAVTIGGATAGFSIDFNAAQGSCANRVGAAIGAYVNGTLVSSGQSVGGAGGQSGFIRFDIALP